MWTFPARALLALAASLLALLAVAAPAGAHHTIEGTLQGVHADYFDAGASVTDWRLDTGSRTIDVLPTRLPSLSPGADRVAVDDKDPGAGVVGPVTAAAPQAAPALGGRTTAVIAFNFATDLRTPWTPAQIRSSVFEAGNSTSAFFREETNNQLWLAGKAGNLDGDVFGWFTLPVLPAGCNYLQWADLAMTAAMTAGFDPTGYQHIMYLFPAQSSCAWAGLAYMPGTESWINGELSVRVTGHELSHNLGLHHAGAWLCTGASGQPVSISGACSLQEYNDPFDVMGSAGSRHSHAWNLQRLGVLQPENVQTVSTSGTYSMTSNPIAPVTGPTTLRIPRTRNSSGVVEDWYYLEIRKPGGVFDNFGANDFVVKGVSIRVDDDPSRTTRSRLVDTHPGGTIYDAALQPGETFSDGTISVTTVSAGSGAASVAVNLSAPPLDQQAPAAPVSLSHAFTGARLRLSWSSGGDNVGVTSYPVYRDGVEIGSSTSTSYEDLTVLPGEHVYTVYAQDAAGNRSPASAPHTVNVPSARVSSLRTGQADRTAPRVRLVRRRLPGGRIRLTAKARDSGGIARLELRIDGRKVLARRYSRVSYRWRLRPGRHRVVALAFDRSGNRGTYRLHLRIPRA